MSLDYGLYLAEQRHPEALVQEIVQAVAPGRAGEPLEYVGDGVGTGVIDHVWLHASAARSPSDRWLQEDLLGFLPRTHVSMRLDKEAVTAAELRVLEVTAAVLRVTRGDAALAWQTDWAVMRRRGSDVEIDLSRSIWKVRELRERAREIWGV